MTLQSVSSAVYTKVWEEDERVGGKTGDNKGDKDSRKEYESLMEKPKLYSARFSHSRSIVAVGTVGVEVDGWMVVVTMMGWN